MAKMLLGALVLIFSLANIFTDAAPVSRAGAGEAADPSSSSSSSVLYYNHQPAEPARAPASPSRARPKRCTCYSYKDMECVYYCHLGIIWINTPQRTVPYGMSSYRSAQRVRRSSDTIGVQRCTCAEFSDAQCHDFCDARTQNRQKIDRTLPWVKSCLHLYPSSFCDQDS